MLALENILWVVPGMVFIFLYNKIRPVGSIQLSGWPYVFFLVFIAAFTWSPVEWFVTNNNEYFPFLPEKVFILFFSVCLSCVLLYLFRKTSLPYWYHFDEYDNFCFKCIGLEGYSIFLTLKNEKAYVGILWKYPEDPTEKYEYQTISIIPLQSGFRREDKTINWNIYYPHYQEDDEMEMFIPRSEIVTFAKFNPEVHKYFSETIKQEATSAPSK